LVIGDGLHCQLRPSTACAPRPEQDNGPPAAARRSHEFPHLLVGEVKISGETAGAEARRIVASEEFVKGIARLGSLDEAFVMEQPAAVDDDQIGTLDGP
jgi:hypothetical protein